MKARSTFVSGCTLLSAILSQTEISQAGWRCLRQPAQDRGIAIYSPVECPDPCEEPVGGCYRHTPYYPGYLPEKCPTLWSPQSGYSITGPGYFGNVAAPYGRGDFGSFTGASKDASLLSRLGGRSNSAGVYQPTNPTTGDLIDRIQGVR